MLKPLVAIELWKGKWGIYNGKKWFFWYYPSKQRAEEIIANINKNRTTESDGGNFMFDFPEKPSKDFSTPKHDQLEKKHQ